MLQYMDSDDSYETTSEVFKDDNVLSLNTSQESLDRNSPEILDLYVSTLSDPWTSKNQKNEVLPKLALKLKEQEFRIQKLKEERVGFLEQITQLCLAVETKERELFELVQSYEHKVNDVARYMQDVQGLLSQLTNFFSKSTNTEHYAQSNVDDLKSEMANAEKQTSASLKLNCSDCQESWTSHGRALLQALSTTVETISVKNMGGNLTTNKTSDRRDNYLDHKLRFIDRKQSISKSKQPESRQSPDSPYQLDPIRSTVCQLPVFCWSSEHVLYWLTEYACLPGACLEAAKGLKLDGKQLATLPVSKAEKLFHLSDNGLRRKFQLALEDLRVHGSPGLSRYPGPSHLSPTWICNIWLRHFLGLAHLAPAFAFRRVDGRMLASLATARPITRGSVKSVMKFRNRSFLLSKSQRMVECNGSLIQLPSTPQPFSDLSWKDSCSVNGIEHEFKWRGATRREMNQILLGVGGDSSTGSHGSSKPTKCLLGRTEVFSLRAGIELLRRFNFNVELLAKAQESCENTNENLLVWTNSRVTKWLKEIGLGDFTHGIEGSGLHGAFMVLDRSFDVLRLIKCLNVPSSLAASLRLADHLQAILLPARRNEGISLKQNKFFRRRSINRLGISSGNRQSETSSIPVDQGALLTSSSITATPQLSTRSDFQVNEKDIKTATLKIKSPNIDETELTKNEDHKQSVSIFTESQLSCGLCDPGISKFEKQAGISNQMETSENRQETVLRKQINEKTKFTPTCDRAGVGRAVNLFRSASNISTSVSIQSPLSKRSREQTTKEDSSEMFRYGLKPSEAPLVDPFSDDTKRNRFRILLGQTSRIPNTSSVTISSPAVATKSPGASLSNSTCSPYPKIVETGSSQADRLHIEPPHSDLVVDLSVRLKQKDICL